MRWFRNSLLFAGLSNHASSVGVYDKSLLIKTTRFMTLLSVKQPPVCDAFSTVAKDPTFLGHRGLIRRTYQYSLVPSVVWVLLHCYISKWHHAIPTHTDKYGDDLSEIKPLLLCVCYGIFSITSYRHCQEFHSL